MNIDKITISTDDGDCPVLVLKPESKASLPAVLFYMDAGGIRPASVQMAERLAAAGYIVLVPDLFYRFGPYGPLVPEEVFQGDVMAILGPLMATTNNAKAAADTAAFINYLDSRDDAQSKFGAVGFCMGGGMALTAAATYPDRFAAVASFHGGSLATDDPNSPHLLMPQMQAEVYIAAADGDVLYPPEMAERFEAAMGSAKVRYRAETYTGARHGWMKPDFPVFDEEAANRGWCELLALFDRTLR
ncbi:dienelactone hydrolase family protein [Parasphingopyxis algicola]|uniref:dienelactone hydrolase family protein n=1 Tax=Parasphingopyxis algicola TaxID=2026624 RepID=UPI0015A4E4B4|nr:dienelactone hydrolase family protein [Parasphingopyxis algicola]QLC24862.1 dienelactone hydrolase family protein [Parasphingopyxis algicola]